MVDHVLVPMDESPLAERALDFALDVHPDATITVLFVVDYVEESYEAQMLVGPAEIRERALNRADALFETVREHTADHGGEVRTVAEFGKPARVVPRYAAEHGVDHIVIGSHGRSLVSRILVGDVARTVVERAPVPVTLVR